MNINVLARCRSLPRLRWLAVAGVLVAAVGLAGCSGSSKQGPQVASAGNNSGTNGPANGASSSTDRQESPEKFAQCMRANGVDMADPQPGSNSFKLPTGNKAKTDAAVQKCQHFLGGGTANQNDPKMKDFIAKIDHCLREQGIDVQDTPNGPKINDSRADHQKVEAAFSFCEKKVGHP